MSDTDSPASPPVVRRPPRAPAPLPGPLDRATDLVLKGVTPEQLDKLLDVQHKWEAEQARRAYVRAMAAFKSEPLKAVVKKKQVRFKLKNRDGTPGDRELSYKHETLDQVIASVVEPMAKHGLAHRWDVRQDQNRMITVSCVVTHEQGHSERCELFGLPDDSGQKNALQQVRSTITFLQRATLLLITGTAPVGEDDDGAGSGPRPQSAGGTGLATEKQRQLLTKKLSKAEIPEAELLAHLGIAALDALEFNRVNDALAWIDQRAAG